MPTNGMTIDSLNIVSSLTAQDEVPVWDKEASGEHTRKITAQNMANSVKSLANLPNTTEMNTAIEQSTATFNTQHDTYTLANGAKVSCRRSGNVVTLNVEGIGSVTNISSGADFYFDVGMDAKYRPTENMRVYGVARGDWSYTGALMYFVTTNGYISGYAYQIITNGGFTITYVV